MNLRQVICLGGLASTLALSACGDGDPQNPPPTMDPAQGDLCDNPLSGTLSRSCRLSADRSWLLKGQALVPSGITLTIEPGTTVRGEVGTPVSYLNIDRGGKLMAEGTKDRPIVFTSERAPGERAPGDWGGVVLRGRAGVNLPGGEGDREGEAGRFGGGASPDDNDSSGVLRYVRIEFAGRVISADNELNALTLGAVGRGTKIEYVQTHQGLDDGIELFGGTVDLKRCVMSAGQDDGLDWDLGWRGRAQFIVVQQHLVDGNNGIEADSNRDNNDLTPISDPTVYNMTLVGTGRGSAPTGQPRYGLTLRRGTAGKLYNLLIIGFTDTGVVMTEDSTTRRIADGQLELDHSLFFANGKTDATNLYDPAQKSLPHDPMDPAKTFDIQGWLLAAERNNRELDPRLIRPFDTAAPRFAPESGSPALSGARQPPQDGFFEAAEYIGAVGQKEDWTAGWTAFPAN